MKIIKIKEDITSEIANSFKNSIAIDTEATGLQIPERDKLSLIQICDEKENVYIIQPNKKTYKAPNLVSVLENDKILKIGHFLRFDKSALEFFLKCKMKNIFDTNFRIPYGSHTSWASRGMMGRGRWFMLTAKYSF